MCFSFFYGPGRRVVVCSCHTVAHGNQSFLQLDIHGVAFFATYMMNNQSISTNRELCTWVWFILEHVNWGLTTRCRCGIFRLYRLWGPIFILPTLTLLSSLVSSPWPCLGIPSCGLRHALLLNDRTVDFGLTILSVDRIASAIDLWMDMLARRAILDLRMIIPTA